MVEVYNWNPEFFQSLKPEDRLALDLALWSRLAEAEREATKRAQERQSKEAEDKRRLPGLQNRLSIEELIERQKDRKNGD